MPKFYLLCLLILSLSHFVRSWQSFYFENDIINDEKIYFPGKTNEDEVNLKRFKNSLSNSLIRERFSNRIDDDAESSERQHSSFSHRKPSMSGAIIEKAPTRISSSFEIDTYGVNNNTSAFLIKKVIEKTKSFVDDSDESKNKSSTLNQRNLKLTNVRIPPPSVIASSSTKSTLRVCEIKYAEYIQRIFPEDSDTASDANDEELNGRILAAPGEYPHMSAVGFPASNGKMDYKCGGSLISETFVITAAHCTNFTGLQPTKVRIGDLNLMIEESYLEPQIRYIKKIYVHPDYKRKSYYNDIALLELEKEVELTEFVRPIRLWTQETIPFTTAYAMGYGSTEFARQRINRLTNLNMTIVPNDECNREMPKSPDMERGIISNQICAKDYALNRDTCQGDSGGPLQLNIRGRKSQNHLHYQLIGITSFGLYCRSGYPSIFTRVCSYLDWIEHIVWKDYFK